MNPMQQQQQQQQQHMMMLAQQQQMGQMGGQMTPQQTQIYQAQLAQQQQLLAQQQQQQMMSGGAPLLTDSHKRLNVNSLVELFDHQKAILYRMAEIEWGNQNSTVTTIGVLADPPGYGKTFPILALILREKLEKGRTQNLIVLPENLLTQWKEAIMLFSKELTFGLLTNYSIVSQLNIDSRPLIAADIILTTQIFYPSIASIMTQRHQWFNRVVIDEADSVSFFTEQSIPSKNVWLVSASIVQLAKGAYYKYKSTNLIKCDDSFVKRSIKLPPANEQVHLCVNPYVDLLEGVLGKMQGVYALDFSGLKFDNLPGRRPSVRNARDAFSAVFRDWSMGLANIVESIPSLEDASRVNALDISVQETLKETVAKRNALMQKLQIMYDKTEGRICPICVEAYTFESPPMKTPCCGASFCGSCMANHLGRYQKCLKCFRPLKEEHLQQGELKNAADVLVQGVDKIEKFQELLEVERQNPNFRALIFSDYSGTFREIFPILETMGLKFAEIEGSVRAIDQSLEQFKSGERPILIISSLQYGAGMNLPMCTCVFLMHCTSKRAQVVGRAQRLGRTPGSNLHVHELVYRNEVENVNKHK